MKKIAKVFSVILSLALIISALPLSSVTANAATETQQVVFIEGNNMEGNICNPGGYGTGTTYTFSGTQDAWRNNFNINKESSTVDFSSCTHLTMTLDLSTTTAGYTATEAYNYWLGHMYVVIRSGNGNWSRYPLPVATSETVKVYVDLSMLRDLDLSRIARVGIKTVPASANWRSDSNINTSLYTDFNNGYTDANAPSFSFHCSKVYGVTIEQPNTDTEKFISNGTLRFWGKGAGNFNWCNMPVTLSEAVDISAYDYLEYDLYISDADRLRTEVDGSSRTWTTTNVRIGASDSNYITKSIDSVNLESGYNHIKVPVSDLGSKASALKFFEFYNNNNSMQYVSGQTWNYVLGIFNIKATKEEIPEVTNGILLSSGTSMYTWSSGQKANTVNKTVTLSETKDLSKYGKMYLDVYVSDVNGLKSLTSYSSFNMLIRTSDEQWANYYRYEFSDQLKNDGWNHITIDFSGYTQRNGSPDLSTVKNFYFYIESNNNAVADKDYRIMITNISVAKPDKYVCYEEGAAFTWASGQNKAYADRYYAFSEVENFTDTEVIQFEYYVSDKNSLFAESGFDGFRILIQTANDAYTNVFKAGFTVTGSGWNTVKLNKSNFSKLGSPSWSTVRGVRIYMENSSLVASKNYTFQMRKFTSIKASATAYSMFGNNMLLQQKKPVTVNGTGDAGCEVEVKILDGSAVVASNTGVVGENGKWEVTVNCSINGGYKTYDMLVLANDFEVHHYTGVVFGELWLAFGQSNMAFKMWETPEGDTYYDTQSFPNGNIHIYTNSNSYAVFKDPHEATTGGWILGNTQAAHNVSAVGYWFADTLQKTLNMPVGFLDAPLGGTGIEAWLSREAIENDAELKSLMQANNLYTSYEGMDSATSHTTATNCYNQIAPLEVFNIAGAIWYQGENNVPNSAAFYNKALTKIIDTYSEYYGFDGPMPFIMTQIAPYGYTGINLPTMWETQANVWSNYSSTSALVPIYDLSLEWAYGDWATWGTGGHPIHPFTKKPVGQRMGAEALSLVYGIGDEYTAPAYSSLTVNGKYVDVTFSHVGDGLATYDGTTLKGFTIAGADGVYLNAKATIINSNTVRVWNDYLNSPVAVAYAFNTFPTKYNLSSTQDGDFFQLAVPFRSSVIPGASYLANDYWMGADYASTWLPVVETPNIYDIWSATNANVSIDTINKYYGDGSLKVQNSSSGIFSVSPNLVPNSSQNFRDVKYDYSNINTIYFKVKSSISTSISSIKFTNGTTPVSLEYMIDGNEATSSISPGAWREVAVDLTNSGVTLDSVKGITIEFFSPAGATVNIDDFTLSRSVLPIGNQMSVIPDLNNVYNTVDYIPGVQHTIELSAGENAYPSKGYFRLSKTLNTLNAEYIEMDIYATAATDLTPSFWVSNDRESASVRGKYTIPQLSAGWNHIVINTATPISANGSYTFSGYNFVYPFIEGGFYSPSHPTGGTVRIANISVTRNLVAPTDIMSDNTAFMSETLKSVTLSNDGAYDFQFSSTDISNTRMMELDVYVTDNAFNAVTVRVEDTDGNYAYYEFTGLTSGWNHLAVRITDLTEGTGNAKALDLTKVSKFTLAGTAGAEFTVANAYAADYVEGDANRDGVFDLKDIVRAKKMAAGATTEGNKLAVSGNDYEINAVDLTNLIYSLIDTLFS